MALVNCPDCGKEISDMAKVCPSCGAPNPYYQSDKPLAGEAYVACSRHSDRKSVVQCNECGVTMCNECSIGSVEFADGTHLCPECYLKFCKKTRNSYIKSAICSSLSLLWYALFLIAAISALYSTKANDSGQGNIMNAWFIMAFAAFLPFMASYIDKTTQSFIGSLFFAKNIGLALIMGLTLLFLFGPIVGAVLIFRHIKNLLIIKNRLRENGENLNRIKSVVAERKANL